MPSTKPVVGHQLYEVESGIASSWLRNAGDRHITEVFPGHWNLVSQQPEGSAMGKGSGADSVNVWAQEIGLDVDDDQGTQISLDAKQSVLESKCLLKQDDFRRIVEDLLG